MHWFTYSVLVTILCGYWQESAAQTGSLIRTEEPTVGYDIFENENNTQTLTTELNSNDLILPQNARDKTNASKREVGEKAENKTFNDMKPLLLFPILPFLFPPREEEGLRPRNEEVSLENNQTSNPTEAKPFILLDFAFNIQRIPIKNISIGSNDSKIINVKKISANDGDVSKISGRRRRNTKMETPGFFDDAPFFPDSEMEEFLPKPDLFFPDLPFFHKPVKKLSRRKRDQKKTEMKNDLKSFFDAFDEAFMRTKREMEWTDPILNFLRGGEQPFQEEKKSDADLFGPMSEIQKKPSVKWRIQRNIKRLNDIPDGLAKTQDSPTIIVDKVVKIGEFHLQDDDKMKRKREMMDSKGGMMEKGDEKIIPTENDEMAPKSIFELISQEGRKGRGSYSGEEALKKRGSEELNNPSQINPVFISNDGKDTSKSNKRETIENLGIKDLNQTENLPKIMKMFDSLKNKMQLDLENVEQQNKMAKLKSSAREQISTKKLLRQDLRKNLTELLKQFIVINKKLDEAKEMDKLEVDEPKVINFNQKETQDATAANNRRQKKDAYFENDYVTTEKKQRNVANLNSLFLNVTVPTAIVFGVVLLVCFYSLQVRGKVCKKLFRPRQVLIINDEATTQLKNPGMKKVQPI